MCLCKKKNHFTTGRVRQFYGRISLLFVILIFPGISFAQTEDSTKNTIVNQQIWIDFYPHYFVNKKFEYYGDAGYRTIVNNGSWRRLYARPSLKYHLNGYWEFHAGLGLFYIFNKDAFNQFEVTPWQGIQLNWPKWDRIGFNQLIKLEERFSFTTDDWNLNFELRFRYKLSGKVNLFDKWYIPFYGEYFLPLEGEVKELYRNKGRAGIGLGYKPSKDWQIAFVLNWQTSRTGPNEKLNVSDYAYQIKIKKVWKRILFK